MFDELASIAVNLLLASVCDSQTISVTHDGEPARYLLLDPVSRVVFARWTKHGEELIIPRAMRMLIEPIDSVRIRTMIDVLVGWTVH
jgi:hypothetical protein